MKKSSILIPARPNGSQNAAKLIVAKAEKPAPDGKAVGAVGGGNLLMKKLLAKNKAEEKDNASDDDNKRMSIVPGSSRPSISAGSGSRLSIAGLMASRRFAKRLMSRALEKRESTLGDGPPTILYEPTYCMEPKSKFQPSDVLAIVKEVVDSRVKDMK